MVDDADAEKDQLAREYARSAWAWVKRPKPTPRDALVDVSIALDELCRAHLLNTGHHALMPDWADPLSNALFNLAPVLADAVGSEITPEDLYFILGSAVALVTAPANEFHADRVDYVAILSALLKLAFHRQLLGERGFPMANAVQRIQPMTVLRLPSDRIH